MLTRIPILIIICCIALASTQVLGQIIDVRNAQDTGTGSLRAAIEKVNQGQGNVIRFNIAGTGPHTITLQTALPTIRRKVSILGTTQYGYDHTNDKPAIILDGRNLGQNTAGIKIDADNCQIEGLAIVNCGKQYGRGYGISTSADYTVITECLIGVLPNEIVAGNSDGVYLGGKFSGVFNNTISGNTKHGILIYGDLNEVTDNRIGTNQAGSTAIPNRVGIRISGNNNIIGKSGKPNILAGNEIYGVIAIPYVRNGQQIGGRNNKIQYNYVGTNNQSNNNATLGQTMGVALQGLTRGNRISYNVVANNHVGISVHGDNATALSTDNLVFHNKIGTDLTGQQARGNSIGIYVYQATDIVIGSGTYGYQGGNLISSNQVGIKLGIRAQKIQVSQNLIGTQADGQSELGNQEEGILCEGCMDTKIDGNTIAYNQTGVGMMKSNVTGIFPRGNKLSNNYMFMNAQGVDLNQDGITTYDVDDPDETANRSQNFPELTQAEYSTLTRTLELDYSVPTLPTNAAYPLTIEYYLSDGNRQGKTWLGADVYLAGDAKQTKTALILPFGNMTISAGDKIVALATDADGNTSEFSEDVTVTTAGDPNLTVTGVYPYQC